MNIQTILTAARASSTEALQLFDALDPVDLAFLQGRWRGSGLHTSHPLDGLLEAAHWYGKEFIDADHVHPLLFSDRRGGVFPVAPPAILMPWALSLPLLRTDWWRPLLRALIPLLRTGKSQARLRRVEVRGKVGAAMLYDHLPIIDAFRKVDDTTVLGLMEYEPLTQPFFFLLRRSPAQPLESASDSKEADSSAVDAAGVPFAPCGNPPGPPS